MNILLAAFLAASSCPSPAQLSKPWIEHSGPVPAEVHVNHLFAALDAAEPELIQHEGASRWIGGSRRGRGAEPAGPGCFALGSAALYDNGPEDEPAVDFVKTVEGGSEGSLGGRLVELRWYDPKDGRKHRWTKKGWSLPLPQAINELL